MKNKSFFGEVLKKALAFLMVLSIAVSFLQPLNAQAKAKVNKVKLANVGRLVGYDEQFNASKPLKKGKNKVIVCTKNGTVFQGYAKFVAPATKTYTMKFGNLAAKNGKKNYVYGGLAGSFVKGNPDPDALKYYGGCGTIIDLGSKPNSRYKKSVTATFELLQGQPVYFYFIFNSRSKTKNVSLDVKIK
ncbi:MAG: hypothetical protein K6G06_08675 [Butyrivibrio sp.]|nr:hypothetical protein [Butyrivibrio sp.]